MDLSAPPSRQKRSRLLLLAAVPLAALLALWGPLARAAQKEPYARLAVLTKVFQIVSDHYVEPISFDTLIDNAIRGILENLDPHSSYITQEEFSSFQESTSGKFGGLGMEVTLRDGVLTIISPIEDTPASRAGLEPGDQIVGVDGQSTQGMRLGESVELLRGKPGTEVVLEILREGWDEPHAFTLTREVIRTKSVRYKLLDPDYGYVRINAFQEQTARELDAAIDTLSSRSGGPLKGLVLDLRQNPGGLLDEAVAVSDIFLESGIVVSTRGREGSEPTQFAATPNKKKRLFPMAVLIDGGSASASEIVAGALQDHGRAVLVGMPSFGKGSVQTIIKLDDGSALRLTTALYYTPSGRLIQAEGIEPDFRVSPAEAAAIASHFRRPHREQDLQNHIENLQGGTAPSERDPPWWEDDAQLAHAVQLVESFALFERTRRMDEVTE